MALSLGDISRMDMAPSSFLAEVRALVQDTVCYEYLYDGLRRKVVGAVQSDIITRVLSTTDPKTRAGLLEWHHAMRSTTALIEALRTSEPHSPHDSARLLLITRIDVLRNVTSDIILQGSQSEKVQP